MKKCNTDFLEKYFGLFDESRLSLESRNELSELFTKDMSFVLNGYRKNGIDEWKKFVDMIYMNNSQIHHVYEGWIYNESNGKYETRWALCGKAKEGIIFTEAGIDYAELAEDGKIKCLEIIADNENFFDMYK